jgi:hypothetical protein
MRPTVTTFAIAAAAGAAAIASAGIASAETPQATIDRLQDSGYQVNVDRVGSGPLSECVVTSVRNPQTVTEWVRVRDGKDKNGNVDYDWVEVVKSRSISVSLDCSR